MRRARIYIAGPMSKGDVPANLRAGMDMFDRLVRLGFAPFCPHWSFMQQTYLPMSWETALEYDMEWLALCDALIRLPGESRGADLEVATCRKLNIPVALSVDALLSMFDAVPDAAETTRFSRSVG